MTGTAADSGPHSGGLGAYVQLTKPRLSTLVLMTTLVGFVAGSRNGLDLTLMAITAVGTLLVVGGANALNQFLERDTDAIMRRTRERPLPAGRLTPARALTFGIVSGIAGIALLVSVVSPVCGAWAAVAYLTYVLAYTPLKRVTPWCTVVGAVPGALPPLIGWAGATGSAELGGWSLFAILFLWQLPHSLAISRLYREDYRRAGMRIISVIDDEGTLTARHMVLSCAVLIPVAVAPTLLGITGGVYLAGGILLGLLFLGAAASNLRAPSITADRRTFYASLVYLTLLLVLIVVDRTPGA